MNRSTTSSSMAGSMSASNSACSCVSATSSWWPVTDWPSFDEPKICIQMWNSSAVTSCTIFLISAIINSSTSLLMTSVPKFRILFDRNLKQRSRVASSPVNIWLKIPVSVPFASNWNMNNNNYCFLFGFVVMTTTRWRRRRSHDLPWPKPTMTCELAAIRRHLRRSIIVPKCLRFWRCAPWNHDTIVANLW